MEMVTRNVTQSELESKSNTNILNLIAESSTTKTNFLSLPRELRQSILRQTVKLNELEDATQQVTDRFLTWDELFNNHEEHIQNWGVTLKLVHREIHADVEYLKQGWEEDFRVFHEERLVAYEDVARKRRAQFLDAQPRFRLPYPSYAQPTSARPRSKARKIRVPRK